MIKDIPFRSQVDQLISQENLKLPMKAEQARKVIALLADCFEDVKDEKEKKKKMVATIFVFLTEGSGAHEPHPGLSDGDLVEHSSRRVRKKTKQRRNKWT